MCDKNLEQRINIKFCVKIGNSASETLALLTLAYDEYATKKSIVFNGTSCSREGEKTWKMTMKCAAKNTKDRCKCGQGTNLDALRSNIMCETNSRIKLRKYVRRKRPTLWPANDVALALEL
jgi:hypothetical protein